MLPRARLDWCSVTRIVTCLLPSLVLTRKPCLGVGFDTVLQVRHSLRSLQLRLLPPSPRHRTIKADASLSHLMPRAPGPLCQAAARPPPPSHLRQRPGWVCVDFANGNVKEQRREQTRVSLLVFASGVCSPCERLGGSPHGPRQETVHFSGSIKS